MPILRVCFASLSLAALALAQAAGQKGPEAGDINRSVDPCTDFYDFANGAWRAQNPIPPAMQRWSRRWAAGESSKDRLKEILDEVSAKPGQPAGSVRQEIGDFYGACMDERAINRAGITPLRPYLNEIDGLKNAKDIQGLIAKFHEIALQIPFAIGSSQDNHNPSQVIADVSASGIGLPDRDYYLKTEARFQDTRAKYLAHVEKIFQLAGFDATASKAAAKTVMAMETRLAEAMLDNVALRDPAATDHKMKFQDLQKLAPHFDWGPISGRRSLPPRT